MTSVHWFRKGLRVHDNEGLKMCLENGKKVLPMVIIDPYFLDKYKVGEN